MAPETLTGLILILVLLIAALTVVLLHRRWNLLLSLVGGVAAGALAYALAVVAMLFWFVNST